LDILNSADKYYHDGTNLVSYDIEFFENLYSRIENLNFINAGDSILCLAARTGAEVKAFKKLGCFAVGIDLNPGDNNEHVLVGDFHKISFPDNSIKIIYTNSLDHAFDLNSLFKEINRVLKKESYFIAELQSGNMESSRVNRGYWEACDWDSSEKIITLICQFGFELVEKKEFQFPWPGQQCIFRKKD
jgi:ubiquinone/menaquinone biosynthesis C-methylase UbiE